MLLNFSDRYENWCFQHGMAVYIAVRQKKCTYITLLIDFVLMCSLLVDAQLPGRGVWQSLVIQLLGGQLQWMA